MSTRIYQTAAAAGIIAILISSFGAYVAFDTLQNQRDLLKSNENIIGSTKEQITQMQTTLEEVKKKVDSVEMATSELDSQLHLLEQGNEEMAARLNTINKTTAGGLEDVKSQLENQGADLTMNLNRTTEELQNRLDGLSSNLTSIDSEVDSLDSELTNLSSEVSGLEGNTGQREKTPVEVYQAAYKSVVVIQTPIGQGSGFLYSGADLIATNWHVVEGETDIQVQFYDRSRSKATIVGTDAYSDVAVIKVENTPPDAKPLELGNSSSLYIGQQVVAIGNPLGLTGSLSSGYVSQINRQIDITGVPIIVPVLQLDITIAPGSSGGPLFDLSGNVVGITNAGTNDGFNFAVPSNTVARVAASLIKDGVYFHPFFGFSAIGLDPEIIQSLNILNVESTQTGLLITNVTEGLPAADVGLTPAVSTTTSDGSPALLAEDIIVEINDQHLFDFSDWWAYVTEHVFPNEPVTLTLWRSGETVTVKITPTLRPQYQG